MDAEGLNQALGLLKEIGRSTETAVNEVFQVVDNMDTLLEETSQYEGIDEKARQTLGEVRSQLSAILSALQFQDITRQQLEAVGALLAGLGQSKDTFDAHAVFDREKSRQTQEEIDSLVEDAKGG